MLFLINRQVRWLNVCLRITSIAMGYHKVCTRIRAVHLSQNLSRNCYHAMSDGMVERANRTIITWRNTCTPEEVNGMTTCERLSLHITPLSTPSPNTHPSSWSMVEQLIYSLKILQQMPLQELQMPMPIQCYRDFVPLFMLLHITLRKPVTAKALLWPSHETYSLCDRCMSHRLTQRSSGAFMVLWQIGSMERHWL